MLFPIIFLTLVFIDILKFISRVEDYLLEGIASITSNLWLFIFTILAFVKWSKVIVQTFSYYCLSPRIQIQVSGNYLPSDVTVIIPTVGDFGIEFQRTIRSILTNNPAQIIVATVGDTTLATQVCHNICANTIKVIAIPEADKRRQFLAAVTHVKTKITAYADDHVFWPKTYLLSMLMPLEDELVGLVGSVKRVIRERGDSILESFLNYIAVVYLERHNFECTATYNIDGGVFVISGRSALIRTEIVQSQDFGSQYKSGKFGSSGTHVQVSIMLISIS